MLTMTVRHTRSEYLAIIEAFLPFELTARKNITTSWEVISPTVQAGWAVKKLTRAAASLAFFYKVARVGECKFTFSEAGLVRQAKDGQMHVTWPEVKRVFRLPTAFLFAKAQGAMPVPYSAMSEQQCLLLEQLLAQVGHGPSNAA
jgi:hypothetical protein